MANEPTTLIRVYVKDIEVLDALIEKHKDFTRADAARVCIEYAKANGVIS